MSGILLARDEDINFIVFDFKDFLKPYLYV
jgi:hypothetical protein